MASEVSVYEYDEDWQRRMRKHREEKIELDYHCFMVDAKREGREEGLVEGRANKAFEIALEMKKAGYPLSEIDDFTGIEFKNNGETINVDRESWRIYIKLAGREEGSAKGKADKASEIAQKVKEAGRPLSEIKAFTGITL